MRKLWAAYCHLYVSAWHQFLGYTKWFRVLNVMFGPVITISIFSFLVPFSANDILFGFLSLYYILLVGTFLVETIIHGVKSVYRQRHV